MQLAGARWWLGGMVLPLAGSCSLLFEPQPALSGDASPQATDARTQPDSAGVNRAMLEDNFESGSPAEGWSGRLLENGDSCIVTTDQAAGGDHSLRCRTDGASGSQAAIYLDFAPTNTLRVEMDVRFETQPNVFLTYLQTSSVTDDTNTRLTSSDLYSNQQIDVWNFKDKSFEYVDLVISTGIWYHIVFNVQIADLDGQASVSVDGEIASLSLDASEAPVNRLLLGITLVRDSIETHTMYMDNIVISEP